MLQMLKIENFQNNKYSFLKKHDGNKGIFKIHNIL